MTDKKIRGQNFNYLFLEERENTIEIDVSCSDFNFARAEIEKTFFALWDRFPDMQIARYKITFEIYPEDEVEDV